MLRSTTGMFGMLDYRAHKLYRLLTVPLRLFDNIGGLLFLASCVFFTGQHFTGSSSPVAHFLLMATDTRGYVRSLAPTIRLLYGEQIGRRLNAYMAAARDLKNEELDPTVHDIKQRAAVGKIGRTETLMVNPWFRSSVFSYGLLLAFFALYYYLGLG